MIHFFGLLLRGCFSLLGLMVQHSDALLYDIGPKVSVKVGDVCHAGDALLHTVLEDILCIGKDRIIEAGIRDHHFLPLFTLLTQSLAHSIYPVVIHNVLFLGTVQHLTIPFRQPLGLRDLLIFGMTVEDVIPIVRRAGPDVNSLKPFL